MKTLALITTTIILASCQNPPGDMTAKESATPAPDLDTLIASGASSEEVAKAAIAKIKNAKCKCQ